MHRPSRTPACLALSLLGIAVWSLLPAPVTAAGVMISGVRDAVQPTEERRVFGPTAKAVALSGGFLASAASREVKGGVPTLIYHGVPEGTCLATSADDDLIEWSKHPANPVIRVPAPGDPDGRRYAVYDPCAWRRGDM